MKKGIAKAMACVVLLTSISWTGPVQARESQKLTPADLTFRKVWTARNKFNSKVDIANMDFSQIQS